jgi:hypothetical protein
MNIYLRVAGGQHYCLRKDWQLVPVGTLQEVRDLERTQRQFAIIRLDTLPVYLDGDMLYSRPRQKQFKLSWQSARGSFNCNGTHYKTIEAAIKAARSVKVAY